MTLPSGNLEFAVWAQYEEYPALGVASLGLPGNLGLGITDTVQVMLPGVVTKRFQRQDGDDWLALRAGVVRFGYDDGLGWALSPTAGAKLRFSFGRAVLIEPYVESSSTFYFNRGPAHIIGYRLGVGLVWSLGDRVALALAPGAGHDFWNFSAYGTAPFSETRIELLVPTVPLVVLNVAPWLDLTVNPGVGFANFGHGWQVSWWSMGAGAQLRVDLF